MNYLSHSLLSGTNELILTGNFVGDFVKGRNLTMYPYDVQTGVLLHRYIDSYTDTSPIVKDCKKFFITSYGKYSGIIVDIIFDYFLSLHWQQFTHIPKNIYISHVYTVLQKYIAILPQRAQRIVPPIIYYNWLQNYGSINGIQKVLNRMILRKGIPSATTECIDILRKNHSVLEKYFLLFFYELQNKIQTEDFFVAHLSILPQRIM
ncbi:MAG: ACP phosphodiesterase [Bacteroidales bacterium]